MPDLSSDDIQSLINSQGAEAAPPEEQHPIPGQRWLGSYNVEHEIVWQAGQRAWTALEPSSCEHVLIVELNTLDHMRDAAWDGLHAAKSIHLCETVDSRLVLESRFEIYKLPEGQTLRAWIDKNGPAAPELVTKWAGHLHKALKTLHAHNVAHGCLSPDIIYLCEDEERGQILVVGGLERSVMFKREELIQLSGDPFYAPPESAGLLRQTPGDPMKAWDWWSMGRVIQELMLGRHILEHLLDHKLDRSGAEERDQAEKLLLEKAHGNTKAGGLEAMPPIDKRIDLLLQGLLSSSRDARWSESDVDEWLEGRSPVARYQVDRGERLFKWRGKCLTIPEAAELFRSSEHWLVGPDQLLRKDVPDTLISFIREQPSLRLLAQKIEESLALANAPDLRSYNINLIREVLVAQALHKLAGGRFVWKGRKLDSTCIREMLTEEEKVEEGLNRVQLLCTVPILAPLEKSDFEAWRVLSDGAKLAAKAMVIATRLGLLNRADATETARIWAMAFDSPTVWMEDIKKLRETYACSQKPEIQELFTKQQNALIEENLVLAWLIPFVDKLSFITHQEWSKREFGKLAQRGNLLVYVLFWMRLRGALRAGLWWFGPIGLLAAAWLSVSAMLALAWPGPFYLPLVLAPLFLAMLMRLACGPMILPRLRAFTGKAAKWKLLDGTPRCDAEMRRHGEARLKQGEILNELTEINTAIGELKHLTPPPSPLPIPARLHQLQLVGLLSWAALIAPSTLAILKIRATPNPVDTFMLTWFPKEAELEYYPPPPPYKIEFPFNVPKKLRSLQMEAMTEPTEIQEKLGIRRGVSLTGGYTPESIPCMILVRVPSDQKLSFVVYDPAKSELASKKVYHVKVAPKRKTFCTIEGKTAFILDY